MDFLSNKNILECYKEALRSRKYKQEVYLFNLNLEENILKIMSDIQNRTYQHQPYRLLIINDNKKRYISSPSFRDHVLHHLVYKVCYPVIDKRIPDNSFATRLNKGHYKAIEYFFKKLKRLDLSNNVYFLKIDVSKYFYSIPHQELKAKIFKYIHNENLQFVINSVIDSYISDGKFNPIFKPNSNYINIAKKGLPIGAIHSQLFANFYLYELDHFINQALKPKIYLRYMDDLIFVDDLERLKQIKKLVVNFLEHKLLLNVNPKKVCINKLHFGIGLLGYKIMALRGKPIIEVNKRNKKKFWKSVDVLRKFNFENYTDKDKQRFLSVINSRKSMFVHTPQHSKYLITASDFF